MATIIGIDPGKNGALSFIDPIAHTIHIYDTPWENIGQSGKRWEVRGEKIADWVFEHDATHGIIEDVWSMTGDGNVGAFSFGCAFGIALGCLRGIGVKVHRVTPQVWKKNMRCPADKEGAKARAEKLIPAIAPTIKRVKDDGRAEAALLGLYATFYHGYKLQEPLTLAGLNDEKYLSTRPTEKEIQSGRGRTVL